MEKIPVAILTGFLGSGKTTVLNRLVRDAGMARRWSSSTSWATWGSTTSSSSARPATSCCCRSAVCAAPCAAIWSTRWKRLSTRSKRGEIEPFDRVVVETTGLADPQPIMQAFLADPLLARQFDLRSITTTVDALVGNDTLDRHAEAVKQAAVADRILLTKTDLAGGADLDDLRNAGCAASTRRRRSSRCSSRLRSTRRCYGTALAHRLSHSPASASRCTTQCAVHGRTGSRAGWQSIHCQPHSDLVRTFSFVRDEPIEPECSIAGSPRSSTCADPTCCGSRRSSTSPGCRGRWFCMACSTSFTRRLPKPGRAPTGAREWSSSPMASRSPRPRLARHASIRRSKLLTVHPRPASAPSSAQPRRGTSTRSRCRRRLRYCVLGTSLVLVLRRSLASSSLRSKMTDQALQNMHHQRPITMPAAISRSRAPSTQASSVVMRLRRSVRRSSRRPCISRRTCS